MSDFEAFKGHARPLSPGSSRSRRVSWSLMGLVMVLSGVLYHVAMRRALMGEDSINASFAPVTKENSFEIPVDVAHDDELEVEAKIVREAIASQQDVDHEQEQEEEQEIGSEEDEDVMLEKDLEDLVQEDDSLSIHREKIEYDDEETLELAAEAAVLAAADAAQEDREGGLAFVNEYIEEEGKETEQEDLTSTVDILMAKSSFAGESEALGLESDTLEELLDQQSRNAGDQLDEPEFDVEPDEDEESKPSLPNLSELTPRDMFCKDVGSKDTCEQIQHCYWHSGTRSCRTQLWAMKCSMTKLRSTCTKINSCKWASQKKSIGQYCVEALQEDEEAEIEATLTDPDSVKCKTLTSENLCGKVDKCFWNGETATCRTEPWAMTCDMTQVKPTCAKIPNCRWASRSKTRGKYCIPQVIGSLSSDDDGSDSDDGMERVRVQIGNQTHHLVRCKSLSSKEVCTTLAHCYWKSNSCHTEVEFVPCSSTKLRSTCRGLKHCLWSAKSKSKGKYCVDRYFLENPEELGTNCARIKSRRKCSDSVACEWRSSKPSGRYCDRIVNLRKANEELAEVFPEYASSLFEEKKNSKVTVQVEKSASRDNHYECPLNEECQDAEMIAHVFGLTEDDLLEKTNYDPSSCCTSHDEYVKMLRALTTHFVAVSFSDWWIDEGLLLGAQMFDGYMLPWQSSAVVSVASKSARAIRLVMEKFNKGLFYRPYAIRGCFGSSSPSAQTCRTLSKLSSKKKVTYYVVHNMNIDQGPMLEIHPRLIPRESARCIRSTKGKPIPLGLILPSGPCSHAFHGNEKLRCPKFVDSYLDLLYDSEWRKGKAISSEPLPMPSILDDDIAIDVDNVVPNSTMTTKLFWLDARHCKTPF